MLEGFQRGFQSGFHPAEPGGNAQGGFHSVQPGGGAGDGFMHCLTGDSDLGGDFAQGKVFLAMKGKDTALFFRQQSAVEGGKEGEIHLF